MQNKSLKQTSLQVVLILVVSLVSLEIGITIAWPNVLAARLTTDNSTIFNHQLHITPVGMDMVGESLHPLWSGHFVALLFHYGYGVRPASYCAARPLRRRCRMTFTSHTVAAKQHSLPPAASVDRLIIMLSKLKVICALEAEGLLKEPTRRRHWVHPFMLNEKQNDKMDSLRTAEMKDRVLEVIVLVVELKSQQSEIYFLVIIKWFIIRKKGY